MRVLIVDEHAQRAAKLEWRLADAPDVLVIGCVTSMTEAVEAGPHADVILLGRGQDEELGRKLVRTLAVSHPHVKVLVTGVGEDAWDEILPYLEAGVAGYVTTDETGEGQSGATVEALLEKMRAAHRDEAIISPQVAALVMRRISELAALNGRRPAAVTELSPSTDL